ncbi:DUF916 domain-containing protein [Nocardioides cavernae]|uniref:DUF916 domain-containing protein n=1 Tax=Nocardioides cavernae TaxID=1921566 RepID=A0ABR8NIM1_9ACTN|nr:DUF916 domain-containing protein [Nocardioides cavernae]MBD3926744.1 DUF916 domain-containing protein [Nocardioides cavernae]MBM7512466.1 LPXTG-motif cell wall-anchored protein [Nocardioides cavernae]
MTLVARRVTATLTALILGVGLVLLAGTEAVAADNGAWSVTPTPPEVETATPRNYFVLEGEPGQVVKDSVRIQNFTDKPITFDLYGADGYNTRASGFFALKGLEEPQTDVGAWIRMPFRRLTVAGRTQADVPFTIKVPDNATPGDHVGGVVALNTAIEGTQDADDLKIGVQRAVGARLYLRVAGPVTPDVTVTEVGLDHERGWLPWTGSGNGTVTYTIENTGNVRLAPGTVIALTGLFGRELDTVRPEALVDLLPGQTVTLTEAVTGIGFLDRVTTSVSLEISEGVGDTGQTVSWVIPWLAMALLALLLVGAAWWWRRRRNERQRSFDSVRDAPLITVSSVP